MSVLAYLLAEIYGQNNDTLGFQLVTNRADIVVVIICNVNQNITILEAVHLTDCVTRIHSSNRDDLN